MFELGFFLFGLAFGALLVLVVWFWMLGKQNANTNEYCGDLYDDWCPTETVDTAPVVTDPKPVYTKSRSKRIRSRKKPASSSRKARKNK